MVPWSSETTLMTTEMTEKEVRQWLAGRLKMRVIPAATWQLLVNDGHVTEVLHGEDGAREQIIVRARLLLRAGRPKHPGRSRLQRVERQLTGADREYVETLAAGLAIHLDAKGPIRNFRRRYLRGRLLTENEAAEHLKMGSPKPEHLDAIADWLRKHYSIPWKYPDGAEMFILTGRIRLRSLWIESELMTGPLTPITLRIMPFISARTVERAYRDFQRRLRGGDNRPVEERGLAVLRFVMERRADGGDTESNWTGLMKEWNREHRARRGWQFSERSTFRRAFLRAERAFLPRAVLSAFASSNQTNVGEGAGG